MGFRTRIGLSLLLLVGSIARPVAAETKPTGCERLCHTIDACAAKTDHADLGDLLCDVARCETGDRCLPNARSPSGAYHGPFQFWPSTWRSLCRPIFKKRKLAHCKKKGAIYDTCCATICAADLIASDTNGGLKNWPTCGPRAREAASQRTKAAPAAPTSPPTAPENTP